MNFYVHILASEYNFESPIFTRSVQLGNEVKRMTKEERDSLLKNAGLLQTVSSTDVLKLKAGLGLPWLKLRWLRRCVHMSI